MLKNYLTIAIRNLMKQKTFTFINVLGLGVGVACCMILGLYVHHEMIYDRHHPNAKRIYRVVREHVDQAGKRTFRSRTSGVLLQLLRSEIPGVRISSRVMSPTGIDAWLGTHAQGSMQKFCLADPEILDLFDLPLVRGNRQTALNSPLNKWCFLDVRDDRGAGSFDWFSISLLRRSCAGVFCKGMGRSRSAGFCER